MFLLGFGGVFRLDVLFVFSGAQGKSVYRVCF